MATTHINRKQQGLKVSATTMVLTEYLWTVVVGGIFSFTLAFSMGANDVANNFGTSIGSKSITLRKAILIAAIFEIIGSAALGASVTDSVRTGVYDPSVFGDMPDLLLIANLSALVAGTLWLMFATQLGLPVSATHSLVGGLVGCGLGVNEKAINWGYIGQVIGSWFVSPLLSLCVSAIYFSLLRWLVLRRDNCVKIGFRYLWALIFIICAVSCIFFMVSNPMVFNGTACEQLDETGSLSTYAPCKVSKWVDSHMGVAMGIALGGGAGLTAILCPILYWTAHRRMRTYNLRETVVQADAGSHKSGSVIVAVSDAEANQGMLAAASFQSQDPSAVVETLVNTPAKESGMSTQASGNPVEVAPGCKGFIKKVIDNAPSNADLHADVYSKDAGAAGRAGFAEKFDTRCEQFFTVLQIVSAAVMSLVHGASDVSNAAAPYASVYSIYDQGRFLTTVSVPLWILVMGGLSIAIGLSVFGYRVISRMGIELFHVTPSRGFCAETACATVLIMGAFMGFPLSTTHVAVGAMIGIGLMDRHYDPETGEEIREHRKFGLNFGAISWSVIHNTFAAWIGTLIVSAVISYLLFSFAAFSPTLVTSRYRPCSEWGLGACVV